MAKSLIKPTEMANVFHHYWFVAVLTVTVHSSFFPTFDFSFKYVAFCTGFNLLTPFFMLPYIIMDLPIFVNIASKLDDGISLTRKSPLDYLGRKSESSLFSFLPLIEQKLNAL